MIPAHIGKSALVGHANNTSAIGAAISVRGEASPVSRVSTQNRNSGEIAESGKLWQSYARVRGVFRLAMMARVHLAIQMRQA